MKKGAIALVVVLLLIIAGPIIYFAVRPQNKTVANVYGVDGIGNSPTTLTRTDDAVDFTYSFGNGFKSDFDKAYPWSHIKTVTDEYENVFVKIPKFYSKYSTNSDGSVKLQISNQKLEGFSTLFVDGKGNEIDYVMVGAYEGTGTSERMYSKPGEYPLTALTIDQFRTAAQSNGKGYQQFDFMIMNIINQLFTVEFATTDSQSIFYGYAYAGISGQHTTGITNTAGSNTCRMDSGAFKYRGIENVWGHKWKFVDGITFSGTSVYVSTDPENYVAGYDNLNSTYKRMGIARPLTEGRARGLTVDPNNSSIVYISGIIQLDVDVEYNLADYHYFGKQGEVMTYGGPSGYGTRAGAWCWYSDQFAHSSNTYMGARLCYKPINTFTEA